MRYTIINSDKEYIYSTKDINKLYLYMHNVLGYKLVDSFDSAVELLEQGHFYLITK